MAFPVGLLAEMDAVLRDEQRAARRAEAKMKAKRGR
jgi:hypothetical protein